MCSATIKSMNKPHDCGLLKMPPICIFGHLGARFGFNRDFTFIDDIVCNKKTVYKISSINRSLKDYSSLEKGLVERVSGKEFKLRTLHMWIYFIILPLFFSIDHPTLFIKHELCFKLLIFYPWKKMLKDVNEHTFSTAASVRCSVNGLKFGSFLGILILHKKRVVKTACMASCVPMRPHVAFFHQFHVKRCRYKSDLPFATTIFWMNFHKKLIKSFTHLRVGNIFSYLFLRKHNLHKISIKTASALCLNKKAINLCLWFLNRKR